jgi:DNA-binding transcriptional regulator YhcF (GntR family)
MKIWLSKNSEVPVRDQLVAQVTLGIASGDLKARERLPSTRELARRFKLHQNTISSAYRELATKGLVEFRKGSGVYVAQADDGRAKRNLGFLFEQFLHHAAEAGHSKAEIRAYVQKVLTFSPPARYLVVDSDNALGEIICAEVSEATGRRAKWISPDRLSASAISPTTCVVAMADERSKLEVTLPSGISPVYLKANSVPDRLSGETRPSEDDLIAIVSGWNTFIEFAKVYLLAARIQPEMFITRSTGDRNWQKGLEQATLVICDKLTARQLLNTSRVRVFPLVAASSLAEIEQR